MIDITRELPAGHPTWPGDAGFGLAPTAILGRDGSDVNVLELRTTTHLGTHLDAPWHYDPDGVRLGGIPLARTVGAADVIRLAAPPAGRRTVGPGELPDDLTDLPERVLLATGQANRWDEFPKDFLGIDPALVHELADRGVRLLGTDAPSVDPFGVEGLPSHAACAARDVLIVEGLALAGVPAGRYRLVCLPLRIPHADASPVRALLEPWDDR